ncbi:hypothetical protein [Agromyces allii]|uniref:Uncharacterized protein n=1 Tax=Agromyces allii TaxID=393607 RepID=A0ABP5CB76_9MICO|nr:hypothetical protein [Agromyces allii]
MDWTFWAGLIGIAALWGLTQWMFSNRRRSEKTRARDRESADAMLDVDRGKAQSDVWRGL